MSGIEMQKGVQYRIQGFTDDEIGQQIIDSRIFGPVKNLVLGNHFFKCLVFPNPLYRLL